MRLWVAVLLAATACGDNAPPLSVLVYTRQAEWIHTSNPLASREIEFLGRERGWTVTVSDDPQIFTEERLAETDVVVFSVTSANVLMPAQRELLEPYFKAGHGFVGIHSASYTEFDWPFYNLTLVPVHFRTHPDPSNGAPDKVLAGTLNILAPATPIVAEMPNPWPHPDEYYVFWERPEDIAGLTLLTALDEDSMGSDYPDALRVGFHPNSFSHENEGTRVFYTALGHSDQSYSEPAFVRMLAQGIEWAGAPSYAARTEASLP